MLQVGSNRLIKINGFHFFFNFGSGVFVKFADGLVVTRVVVATSQESSINFSNSGVIFTFCLLGSVVDCGLALDTCLEWVRFLFASKIFSKLGVTVMDFIGEITKIYDYPNTLPTSLVIVSLASFVPFLKSCNLWATVWSCLRETSAFFLIKSRYFCVIMMDFFTVLIKSFKWSNLVNSDLIRS